MVRHIKILFFILIPALLFYYPLAAEMMVNEVMSNEPGGDTSLEWIELHNTDTSETTGNFSLIFYSIDADGVILSFQSEVVRRDPFIVICQNLQSFEATWGDNSGIWGDAAIEDYPLFPKSDDFSLTNTAGTVSLYYVGNVISSLSWSSSGSDGISWERLNPDSAEVHPCEESGGSTPGRTNSRAPMPHDLSLLSVKAIPSGNGLTELQFSIANIGLETVSDDSLFLFADPEQDSIVGREDLIAVTALQDIEAGETTLVTLSFEFDGYFIDLMAQLFDDDRSRNNTVLFSAPGTQYPPVILSEFLADPTPSFRNEWVELRNRSDRSIDIGDWYLGDGDILYPIAAGGYLMESGEYLILCRDSLEFADFYGLIDGTIIEPAGWPSLNNDSDMIMIVDNFGGTADSFSYDSTFGNNYTWGRGEGNGSADIWGRSTDSGGTPGAENVINYPASGGSITINAEPNPFSPSRHGEMAISFVLPAGTFNMRLYDIEGRLVKTFIDNSYAYDGMVTWDGYSDGGRRLPVGIYILFAEVIDIERFKQTIVIAQ